MSNDRLFEAISKNLEIIKKEAVDKVKGEGDDKKEKEENPVELLSRLPKLNQSKGDFEFSANRMFFDDVYFRNSRLIKMCLSYV